MLFAKNRNREWGLLVVLYFPIPSSLYLVFRFVHSCFREFAKFAGDIAPNLRKGLRLCERGCDPDDDGHECGDGGDGRGSVFDQRH